MTYHIVIAEENCKKKIATKAAWATLVKTFGFDGRSVGVGTFFSSRVEYLTLPNLL
jgi:hypothetical protein